MLSGIGLYSFILSFIRSFMYVILLEGAQYKGKRSICSSPVILTADLYHVNLPEEVTKSLTLGPPLLGTLHMHLALCIGWIDD